MNPRALFTGASVVAALALAPHALAAPSERWIIEYDAAAGMCGAQWPEGAASGVISAAREAVGNRLMTGLRRLGAVPGVALHTALCGLIVESGGPLDRAALLALPGVHAATPATALRAAAVGYPEHIGATAAAATGADGRGVAIGIVDSGIDYFQPALGGSGDAARYAANDRTQAADGDDGGRYFPTARVAGGWDFAGADGASPDGDPAPDYGDVADLADATLPAHHGTAVAGVVSAVAPAARLYALKVFGAGARETDTARVVEALEWAADPDGDGSTADALDVVLLPLEGAPDPEEPWRLAPLTAAVSALEALGTTVVAPSGNDGGRAFGVGVPCAIADVLCVGATFPPGMSQRILWVNDPPAVAGPRAMRLAGPGFGAELAAGATVSGAVVTTASPCAAAGWPAATAGAVALLRAPSCGYREAFEAAAAAGAAAVLLTAPSGELETWRVGEASSAAAPAFVVSAETADALAAALAEDVSVTVSAGADAVPAEALSDTVAGFSGRGPAHVFGEAGHAVRAKPDVVAPGYAVSAPLAGPGAALASWDGTSFAAAHVAGVAALVRQAHPGWTAQDVAAAVVTTASGAWQGASELVGANPAGGGDGARAPLASGGAGRVDAAAAVAATLVPERWLDLGLVSVTGPTVVRRTLRVRNDGAAVRTVSARAAFRQAEGERGGLRVTVEPATVSVPVGAWGEVVVTFELDPTGLLPWPHLPPSWEVGGRADAALVAGSERDGWIELEATDGEAARVPFYVLPRPVAAVSSRDVCLAVEDFSVWLDDASVVRGDTEVFSLAGVDPAEPSTLDSHDVVAVGVREDARGEERVLSFAIAMASWDVLPGRWPVAVIVDVDGDGAADFVALSGDAAVTAGGHATGSGRTYLFAPDAEGAYETPLGRMALVSEAWTVADLVGTTRVMSVSRADLGLGDGADFDFWVAVFGESGAVLDTAPARPAAELLGAGEVMHWDTTCSEWRFESGRVSVDTSRQLLLEEAPSCGPEGGAGLLLVHAGNAAGEGDVEVLRPPARAEYTCDAEMRDIAEAETCRGAPVWAQHVEGPCVGAIEVTPRGDATMALGETRVALDIVDPWGNEGSCTTTVVIEDRTGPEIDCGDLAAVELQTGLLPVTHAVTATDACGPAVAEVFAARCLVKAEDGEGLTDVSGDCLFAADGAKLTVVDLGERSNLVEWSVKATDEAGNETVGQCYAKVLRDRVFAKGGGCGAGGGAEGGAWLWLASLGALAALGRRRARWGGGC
ncbi:MAG: S8 family serine peptidase [Deltaproteobacteria bacterium]|nr:S8 family serine peptidase [Deltaproteobacteria bacterium]